MGRKIRSVQISAFMLLVIFVINTVALCSCALGVPLSCNMKMDKDCCCCKHSDPQEDHDCKTSHALSFDRQDKALVYAVSMDIAAVQYFLVSSFVSLPEDNFSFNPPFCHLRQPFIDTGPPDLRVMYQSFLI